MTTTISTFRIGGEAIAGTYTVSVTRGSVAVGLDGAGPSLTLQVGGVLVTLNPEGNH